MIAFICCSATSGFVLNVSIDRKLAPTADRRARAARCMIWPWERGPCARLSSCSHCCVQERRTAIRTSRALHSSASPISGRSSRSAPVFGDRGSLLLRMRVPRAVRFHALAGLGGATVVSKSPYMSTDTDPVLYYGVGAPLALGEIWEMRLDVRQGFMPARAGGSTAIYEAMAGIGLRFGAVPAPAAKPPEEPPLFVFVL